MTQLFNPDGKRVVVTLVQAGPCHVTQIKTKETDGYDSAQIGYEKIKEKKIKKSQVKKPFYNIVEFKECGEGLKVGDEITASSFETGDAVKVSGITKGKGFQGVVRRHGYKGRQSVTHGTKHELRNLGSVGCQGGVRKGKGMPGHMGTQRVTVKNVKIVKIDPEKNIIALSGALPGHKGTVMEIRKI